MPDAETEQLPQGGRRLTIFINQVQVATLHEDHDLWTLAYLPSWATREESFDLCPALPRTQLLNRDGATLRPVQWYFDNLLPEEKLRSSSPPMQSYAITTMPLRCWNTWEPSLQVR